MSQRPPEPSDAATDSSRSSTHAATEHRWEIGWRPSAIRSALIRVASRALASLPEAASTRLARSVLRTAARLGPAAFTLRAHTNLAKPDRAIDHHLASLSPDLDRATRSRLTSGIQTNDLLAIMTRRLRESLGDSWLETLVEPHDSDDLIALRRDARPTIILSWHSGSSAGLLTGLARLEREVRAAYPRSTLPPPLLLRFEPGRVPDGWAQVAADHDPISRGKALQVALKTLRSGGLVVILLDAMRPRPEFPHPAVPFLGRAVRTSPGPAWLARLSGATIIPAHATWRASRADDLDTRTSHAVGSASPALHIDLTFGPAIAHPDPHASDPDLAHTRAIYAWFEAELRSDPSTLWPKSLGHLARCPRL